MKNRIVTLFAFLMSVSAFAGQMNIENAVRIHDEARVTGRSEASSELMDLWSDAKEVLAIHELGEQANDKCCRTGSMFDSCDSSSGKTCHISPTSASCTLNSDNC